MLPDMADDRDAARLCDPGAAARLSHGGDHGHRRRPAAQPREVGHRRIERRAAMTAERSRIAARCAAERRRCRSAPPAHHGVASRLRNYFLTGLILVGPSPSRINLTWWFINWVDDAGAAVHSGRRYRPETYLPFRVPGFGLIIALVGADAARLPHRQPRRPHACRVRREPAQPHADRAADLQDLKQIFETLFSKSGSSFRKVGAGRVSAPGMWSLVFLAAAAERGHRERAAGDEHVSVFMPCTPNPTTGFFFYRAAREVIELDITVEAGDDADHVGRHGRSPSGDAQREARRRWPRDGARRARRGRLAADGLQRRRDVAHPARSSRTASSRSNR